MGFKSTADPREFKDETANSATKTEKTITRKRSRPSPNKKIVKMLLLEEDTATEDGGCEHDIPKPSSNDDA